MQVVTCVVQEQYETPGHEKQLEQRDFGSLSTEEYLTHSRSPPERDGMPEKRYTGQHEQQQHV